MASSELLLYLRSYMALYMADWKNATVGSLVPVATNSNQSSGLSRSRQRKVGSPSYVLALNCRDSSIRKERSWSARCQRQTRKTRSETGLAFFFLFEQLLFAFFEDARYDKLELVFMCEDAANGSHGVVEAVGGGVS